MQTSQSFWITERLGCWEGHHLEQWSHQPIICSAPRHYESPIEDDEGLYESSCYHGQHCLPVQGLRRRGTP
uniref:Uncharacterized protein n=1 Tax=Lepeophtheirus salmonis TaxID=72036 RepID=A0A0K2U8Q0_LEPSM